MGLMRQHLKPSGDCYLALRSLSRPTDRVSLLLKKRALRGPAKGSDDI